MKVVRKDNIKEMTSVLTRLNFERKDQEVNSAILVNAVVDAVFISFGYFLVLSHKVRITTNSMACFVY